MAQKKVKKTIKKPAKKLASAKKVAKKTKISSKSKPIKKSIPKKNVKVYITKKTSPAKKKTVAKKAVKKVLVKKIIVLKNKLLKPVTSIKTPIAKVIVPKEIKAKPVKVPALKSKKEIVAPLPPPPSNLPKLPKGFVLKKQKGKLPPGEKRIFKTNVITHHIISEVPLTETDKKYKPEPKGKYELEFIIHTPVTLLYDFLTTPNGLAEWFADGVDLKDDIYSFDWDGQKQTAKILSAKIDTHIRLRWTDKAEGSYFEFRLNQDELTSEVSLIITDFGDNEDDIMTSKRLWESQIQRLIKALGTY